MNQNFNVEAALESARRANTLMIGEQFTPLSLEDTDPFSLNVQRRALAPHLQQQISHSHHFYFTYPNKLINPGNLDGVPSSSTSVFIRNLHNIHPKFSIVPDSFFLNKMEVLNTAIVNGVNNMDPDSLAHYDSELATALCVSLNKLRMDYPSEDDTAKCFDSIIASPCEEILSFFIESLKKESAPQVLDRNVFTPDITFKVGEVPLLVIEMKCPRLRDFTDGGRGLQEDNALFRSILKQFASYLIRCDLPYGLISDFQTTLFIQPNIPLQNPSQSEINMTLRSGRSNPPYVEVPFGCKVIYNTDTHLPLQAVVASLIYDRYLATQQDRGEGITVELYDGLNSKANLKDDQARALYWALIKEEAAIKKMQSDNIQRKISRLTQSARRYREVDRHKLERITELDVDVGDLEPLRVGSQHVSQVYKLPSKYLQDHVTDKPDQVLMKIYNFSDLEANLKLKRNWWQDWFGRGFNQDDLYEVVSEFFLTEIRCYLRIQHSKEDIRTPYLYDYGVLKAAVNGETKLTGLFMMMTYIESTEEDKKMTEYLKSFDQPGGTELFPLLELAFPDKASDIEVDLMRQVELLDDIGVYHNDWKLSNVKLSNGRFSIFDFSHAELSDI